MRNLSDECKTCSDDHASIAMCFDICSIPIRLLEEIEYNRRKEEEKKEHERYNPFA